jgi:hypothetical protein
MPSWLSAEILSVHVGAIEDGIVRTEQRSGRNRHRHGGMLTAQMSLAYGD